MLPLGTYTKEQLALLLGVKQDTSNIKRSLTRQGYTFTTQRGKEYRITITALPKENETAAAVLSRIVKKDLSVNSEIDITKFAALVCFLECDDRFIDLTLAEMEERTKACNLGISRQTISKYLNILRENNLLDYCIYGRWEYVYYVPLDTGNKYITRKEWLDYWKSVYSKDEMYYTLMLNYLGGQPKKRLKMFFGNALVPCCNELIRMSKQVIKETIGK